MSGLVLERDGTVGVIYDITGSFDDPFDDNYRPQITPPTVEEVVLPQKIRRVKVLRVRQQLACGTYDLDDRIDAILERILADITT
jgi:hypothetical protein